MTRIESDMFQCDPVAGDIYSSVLKRIHSDVVTQIRVTLHTNGSLRELCFHRDIIIDSLENYKKE